MCCLLFVIGCLLFVVRCHHVSCVLRVVGCLLCVCLCVRCVMSVACCLRWSFLLVGLPFAVCACCSLLVVRWLSCGVCCRLFDVCCLLFVVRCLLCAVCCLLFECLRYSCLMFDWCLSVRLHLCVC